MPASQFQDLANNSLQPRTANVPVFPLKLPVGMASIGTTCGHFTARDTTATTTQPWDTSQSGITNPECRSGDFTPPDTTTKNRDFTKRTQFLSLNIGPFEKGYPGESHPFDPTQSPSIAAFHPQKLLRACLKTGKETSGYKLRSSTFRHDEADVLTAEAQRR